MFAIVEAAGWPIWFLIVASVIAVALIAERLMSLRNKKIAPATLFNEVVHELKQRGVSDAMLSRLEKDSPLGRIFAAGLKNMQSSSTVMKESVEEAGRAAAHELERFLTTLGTIASISPLLGLFGTMVGMIEIFGAQSTTDSAPAALAHGISIALYNTAFGLMVAIP
ncbi:MAG: MotA/TolQ/ExbB proton channel family protein, partial [Candidatus Nitrotoga sp.]